MRVGSIGKKELVRAALVVWSIGITIAAQGLPPPPKNPPPPGWIDPRNPPKEDPNWQPPRTPDGQPNIAGQWNQASDIITYSIEDPEADRAGHIAISGQRAMVGRPIIDPIDGKIPYRRQPLDEQWENAVWEGNRTADVVLGGAKK